MRYYCGLDLGARYCQVCVIDEKKKQLVNKKVDNDLSTILALVEPFREEIECVVESTFNWYWLVDGLQDNGLKVYLAHALGLSLISGAKVKTDRRDARTLATLLGAGMIPQAYIYPRETRPLRDLVRSRCRLVRQRASIFGRLRNMLYQQGILEHTCNSVKLKEEEEEEFLNRFKHPHLRLVANHHLEHKSVLDFQIQELEKAILKAIKEWPGYEQLKDIPGIGDILAVTIVVEAGQIERFESARQFSSYCRVIPGVAQSGDSSGRGRGSKQGNAYLKCALTEAAVYARRYNAKIRRCYERCLERHKGRGGKMISNNMVAHKLCCAVYHVLHDGAKYREELLFGN